MAKRLAYVTGGMGGIGTAICQRLYRDGFAVVAGCRVTRDHEAWLRAQHAVGYEVAHSVGDVSAVCGIIDQRAFEPAARACD